MNISTKNKLISLGISPGSGHPKCRYIRQPPRWSRTFSHPSNPPPSFADIMPVPERTAIAGGALEISRMISGLWQLAGGHDSNVDIAQAAAAMRPYVDAGLDCFDMADHYGDAELVVGQYSGSDGGSGKPITAFTKWCPAENGVKTFEYAAKAVDRAASRLGLQNNNKPLDLLQYHIWDYADDTYWHNLVHLRELQRRGKISHIGLTNTDAAHLELLLDSGFSIATNQVSCSVIDRRLVRGRMAKVCRERGVGILAYGTLLGGFLSEKWLGRAQPPDDDDGETLNWSLRKYLRFIREAGGWAAFQGVLRALSVVAKRHNVSIAAVATRYVLDLPSVSAVIVGTRLSPDSGKYIARNLEAFSFKLTDEDAALIAEAQEALTDIPGDCGDEYRREPILTVTGDLSHHLGEAKSDALREAVDAGMRIEYSSGNKWEPIAVCFLLLLSSPNKPHLLSTTTSSHKKQTSRATAALYAPAPRSAYPARQRAAPCRTPCPSSAGIPQRARPTRYSTSSSGRSRRWAGR